MGWQPCIQKSRRYHFSSCVIVQSLYQKPGQIVVEAAYLS